MRVLIVEDEKKIRNFLQRGLKQEFFVADAAEDGQQGLYLARLNNYDIIILDNLLPGKTGLEFCRELREHNTSTPILILSVLGDPQQKISLLNAGADDYLAKPFSFKELVARMKALLRRPQYIENTILTVKGISLDTLKHEVYKGKKKIALTRKEFILFQYFLKNKGTVLSRKMIMEHVWDMNADPFSNTIESHIVSLRRKIGDKNQGVIKTIAGRGYKLLEV